MNFVILIHSNPEPWGHPTFTLTPEGRAIADAERAEMVRKHDRLIAELTATGELLGGRALGAPADGSVYRSSGGSPTVARGPYGATGEHLAGFFLVDVAGRERAEEITRLFVSAGDTVELRTVDHEVGTDRLLPQGPSRSESPAP